MSTTDRAALEKAIEAITTWQRGGPWGLSREMDRVLDAACAHLDTLPKTKMVERWRFSWSQKELRGLFADFDTLDKAYLAMCETLSISEYEGRCISGPHMHEIPA